MIELAITCTHKEPDHDSVTDLFHLAPEFAEANADEWSVTVGVDDITIVAKLPDYDTPGHQSPNPLIDAIVAALPREHWELEITLSRGQAPLPLAGMLALAEANQ